MIAVNHAGDHIPKVTKITIKILFAIQRCSVEAAENLASYFTYFRDFIRGVSI